VKNFTRIVESVQNLTVLGSSILFIKDLRDALSHAPRLFCADGGANSALDAGFTPELVIGDLDSVDLGKLAAAGVASHFVDDQNSTDFEKCLQLLKAPVILAVGFMGRRLDHQLAALNALARFADQPVILIDAVDICFLCPDKLQLQLPEGERFSVFPLSAGQCKSRGLVWKLDDLILSPGGRIATSNKVENGPLYIEVLSGQHICMLPKRNLEAVIAGLALKSPR